MRKLSCLAATAVFVAVFAAYSYRLGLAPVFEHDDYEYTYPSFNLAAHGNYGSPLLGPGYNIEKRTYSLTIYYYATVHAALIRLLGDGPSAIPLGNLFHFALLAALGAFFLLRRGAFLGAAVFLYALTADDRMVATARHGRPEMTAGFCLTAAVLLLWLRLGEGHRERAVLFAASAALAAGMLSHTAVVFFSAALLLALAKPLLRGLRPLDAAVGFAPLAFPPLLFGYFVLTDSLANIRGQMAPGAGDVVLRVLVQHALAGRWATLASVTGEFLHTHLAQPGVWLGVAACLLAPRLISSPLARAARFFASIYASFVVVHFLFLKHYVLSYRCLYQATLYLALALLAEAAAARLAEQWSKPALIHAARLVAAAALVVLAVRCASGFRARLRETPRAPYARVQAALVSALLEARAARGDRVFVPSPFGFHLKESFDVIAHPAPKYFRGRWSPAFREGLRAIWGADAIARKDPQSLCYAMGLAYVRPRWVMAWNGDYGVMRPWWDFLKRFRGLPGIELTLASRTALPEPYSGTVRVYRLSLSDDVQALDRSVNSTPEACP